MIASPATRSARLKGPVARPSRLLMLLASTFELDRLYAGQTITGIAKAFLMWSGSTLAYYGSSLGVALGAPWIQPLLSGLLFFWSISDRLRVIYAIAMDAPTVPFTGEPWADAPSSTVHIIARLYLLLIVLSILYWAAFYVLLF
jgi:TM2 domain-containing membrane protein YozV